MRLGYDRCLTFGLAYWLTLMSQYYCTYCCWCRGAGECCRGCRYCSFRQTGLAFPTSCAWTSCTHLLTLPARPLLRGKSMKGTLPTRLCEQHENDAGSARNGRRKNKKGAQEEQEKDARRASKGRGTSKNIDAGEARKGRLKSKKEFGKGKKAACEE